MSREIPQITRIWGGSARNFGGHGRNAKPRRDQKIWAKKCYPKLCKAIAKLGGKRRMVLGQVLSICSDEEITILGSSRPRESSQKGQKVSCCHELCLDELIQSSLEAAPSHRQRAALSQFIGEFEIQRG
ncbi:hypothetical protein MYX65_08420 [Acidobacteria bacterium AH-259-L09]|nr:hypothetical protein [Acidobacteria bacterium AH-259-L09]